MGWEGWADEKPTKIQKFFQLSVTALAFLAFGGYLLCMIVQAIKSKGMCGILWTVSGEAHLSIYSEQERLITIQHYNQ